MHSWLIGLPPAATSLFTPRTAFKVSLWPPLVALVLRLPLSLSTVHQLGLFLSFGRSLGSRSTVGNISISNRFISGSSALRTLIFPSSVAPVLAPLRGFIARANAKRSSRSWELSRSWLVSNAYFFLPWQNKPIIERFLDRAVRFEKA